jgi:hypothetical protein
MSDLRINFTPKYLPILDVFKAKHDIRYYLCGVHVEKAPQGGVYLLGCDGHTMAVIYDKDGSIEGAESAIISVDPGLVSAAKKAESKKSTRLPYKVTVRGTRVMVAVPDSDGLELFIQPGKCVIEGTYPNWRKVLPDFSKLKPGALAEESVNAVYMARFAKVTTDKRFCGMSIWQEAATKPVVVQMQGLPEAVFVVMPMRQHGDAAAFSAFASPAKEVVELEAEPA